MKKTARRPKKYLRKQPKNLSLAPEAIERGERYGALHGTNLSRLVTDFLLALPLADEALELTPAVRRLFGVAAVSGVADEAGREVYREHLRRKYGGA